MANINLTNALFRGDKEKILLTGVSEKTTNTLGSAGIGFSTYRPAGIRAAAKYSGAAKVLDYLIVNKSVNAIEAADGSIYGEFSHDGKHYSFTANNKRISYTESAPHGFYKLIPPILYYLSDTHVNEELKDAFKKILESYKDTGVADDRALLLFCDSFYYGIAKTYKVEYEVGENELLVETVKQGYKTGFFKSESMSLVKACDPIPFEAFKDVDKAEVKETKKKDTKDAFLKVKNGEYHIPYEWNEKQQLKIPPLSSLDDYIPNKQFWSILNKIHYRLNKVMLRMDGGMTDIEAIDKDYINLFLLGKPGTGKTKTAYALAAALGLPIYTVAMTKNTEEDVFEGMNKVIDGKLTFVETDALEAISNGGIVVLEEINLADPAVVMGAIGQCIEYPFVLMKNGYEAVHRHPLLIVIGTMNIGTYGSKSINQALSSRFKQAYILNDNKEEDFINILRKQVSSSSVSVDESTFNCETYEPIEIEDKHIKWVYMAYNRIVNTLKSDEYSAEDIALSVTMRGCIGALENIEEGEKPKEAIYNTLIGKIAESDLEMAEKIKLAIESLRDI